MLLLHAYVTQIVQQAEPCLLSNLTAAHLAAAHLAPDASAMRAVASYHTAQLSHPPSLAPMFSDHSSWLISAITLANSMCEFPSNTQAQTQLEALLKLWEATRRLLSPLA